MVIGDEMIRTEGLRPNQLLQEYRDELRYASTEHARIRRIYRKNIYGELVLQKRALLEDFAMEVQYDY